MNSITLVSCTSKKRTLPCQARNMYLSQWFVKARRYAEIRQCPWWILSAKHGLLIPEEVIRPYDQALPRDGDNSIWAGSVVSRLRSLVEPCHVVILAGQAYRQHLEPMLVAQGYTVEVPMRGLAIGQQLSWLAAHT